MDPLTKPGDLIRAKSRDTQVYVYFTHMGGQNFLSKLNHGEIVMVLEILPGRKSASGLVKFLWNETVCMARCCDFETMPASSEKDA